MKLRHILSILALTTLLFACEKRNDPTPSSGKPETATKLLERNGESGITYQLLVYTFADSNADGIGDFNGITSKLDYLKEMGVSALWLSPVHPSASYHGYDVKDYYSLNPDFGTEADFKNLLTNAHNKGIKIYLDFVLNHTSREHPWFLEAKTNADSKYRNYYIFSDNPQDDIKNGRIPQIATEGASGYESGQWFTAVTGSNSGLNIKFTLKLNGGKPYTLTAEKNEESTTKAETKASGSGIWLYYGDGKMAEFQKVDDSTLSLSLKVISDWGVLVRTSQTQWDSYKYGASASNNKLEWGIPLKLNNSEAKDILLPGMSGTMYHSHFWTEWFADLNYGKAENCEQSDAFKDVCAAADKWINMGVDGFRLDAIKHIYHNAYSDENPTFLKKFYDHCNASYKAKGHNDNIYMVGEHFSEAREVAPYYKGLPAFFEFSFWWSLKDAINSSKGEHFASTIISYTESYARYRSDFIEATKLTNHDEDRAGSDLSSSKAKMKLAATVLLTAGGQPYIYQGEELGYTGTKSGGDEYVRTGIYWNKDKQPASKYLGSRTKSLSANLSVESQAQDEESVLAVYRKFGDLRDRYYSLSKGSFENCNLFSDKESISAWYRSYGNERILVIHNFSAAPVKLDAEKIDCFKTILSSNGDVTLKSTSSITLGSYASALFIIQ